MKQFRAFIKKEFIHIFRDRRTMLILLGMPVAQIIIFGFAISTEVRNVRLAFYSPTYGGAVGALVEKFGASEYFTVAERVADASRIDELFRDDRADIVLVFEEGFDRNLAETGRASVQLVADGADPNTASILTGYAQNIIADYQREQAPSAGSGGAYAVIPGVRMLYNPQMKSAYNFVPGVMGLILMLVCAMMTSVSIVREKERGTMEVLLVSPVRPLNIILAKAVPYLVLSAVNVITILLLSIFLLKVPVAGSLFWLGLLSLIFIFTALALGLLISSLVKTQVAAVLASGLVLMAPTIILSGMIFPTENMPLPLQLLSNILPAKWYIAGVKKIMIEGLPGGYILDELGILAGMAILLVTVSLLKFKNRLQ